MKMGMGFNVLVIFFFHFCGSFSDTICRTPVIVDFGCGPGNSAKALFQIFSNATIIGLDVASDMITYAQEHNTFVVDEDGNPVLNGCQFYQQDIGADWNEGWSEELRELLEGKVDAIISNYALHWISNFDRLATNVQHLLRPNGRSVFVGNLLYCGDIKTMCESEESRHLIESVVHYPNEKQYISNFLFAFRDAHFDRFVIEYANTFSFFPEGYYKNSKCTIISLKIFINFNIYIILYRFCKYSTKVVSETC